VRSLRSSVLGLAVSALGLAALAATHVGGGSVTQALSVLGDARPGWLLVAGAAFGAGLLCGAAAWRSGLRACGGESAYRDVAARYTIGSLVNSLAPAGVGGAVRIGLLSRTLPGDDPVWRACGIASAIGFARSLGLAGIVLAAAAIGGMPLWPAPLIAVLVSAILALGVRLSTRVAGRVGAVLQVFRSPRVAVDICGWIACAWGLRVLATVAVVAALGIGNAFPVAVLLVAAVALAGLLPLTPGNFGMGAGAATLALHGTGVGTGTALALGLALQTVETFTGIAAGLVGATFVSAPGTRIRRWSVASVTVMAVVMAAMVGMASADLV
jgi:uncharacterized membrane protein YbhN (UPF0104 family)